MASRYKFTEEQIQDLTEAAKATKKTDVDRRLRALLMRAKGKTLDEVAQATEYSYSNITKLVRTYREGGLAAIVENHYGGNHRNMSYEEETALLKPFEKKAEAGQMVNVSEMEVAYQEVVGHPIGTAHIYYVLHRHGWRKVMPRSNHPKKASEEDIESSKKLTLRSRNFIKNTKTRRKSV